MGQISFVTAGIKSGCKNELFVFSYSAENSGHLIQCYYKFLEWYEIVEDFYQTLFVDIFVIVFLCFPLLNSFCWILVSSVCALESLGTKF